MLCVLHILVCFSNIKLYIVFSFLGTEDEALFKGDETCLLKNTKKYCI